MVERKKGTFDTFAEGQDAAPTLEETFAQHRTKCKGKTMHMTVYLTHDQWQRATQLAAAERVSFSQLAIIGISQVLQAKGLSPL